MVAGLRQVQLSGTDQFVSFAAGPHQKPEVRPVFSTKLQKDFAREMLVRRFALACILATDFAPQRRIASALLPDLKEELVHISRESLIFRERETSYRVVCGTFTSSQQLSCDYIFLRSPLDVCLTDLFNCAWFCADCGLEVCGQCRSDIVDSAVVVSGTSTVQGTLMRFRK